MAETQIKVITFFDCTPTGVKGHYRKQPDFTEEQWSRMRNQQRNWETLQQIFSLRCQIFSVEEPLQIVHEEYGSTWYMSFVVEQDDIFRKGEDPLGLLKEDCHGVPMIIGLEETERELFLTPYIVTQTDKPNTLFSMVGTK